MDEHLRRLFRQALHDPIARARLHRTECRALRVEQRVRRIDEAWDELEAWAAHDAPELLASLRPPADPAALGRLREAVGRDLTRSLERSLTRHDGQASRVVLPFRLLGCDEIRASWEANPALPERGWLPIAADGEDIHYLELLDDDIREAEVHLLEEGVELTEGRSFIAGGLTYYMEHLRCTLEGPERDTLAELLMPPTFEPGVVLTPLALVKEADWDEQALDHDPAGPEQDGARGLILERRGKPWEAIALLGRSWDCRPEFASEGPDPDHALQRDAEDLVNRFRRGFRRFQAGEHLGAIMDMSRLLDIEPDCQAALRCRGLAFLESGHLQPSHTDLARYQELLAREGRSDPSLLPHWLRLLSQL